MSKLELYLFVLSIAFLVANTYLFIVGCFLGAKTIGISAGAIAFMTWTLHKTRKEECKELFRVIFKR